MTLVPEARELAEAVRAALDVPHPVDADDCHRHLNLLRSRVINVLATLDYLLDYDQPDEASAVRSLCAATDCNPVTYVPQTTGNRGRA